MRKAQEIFNRKMLPIYDIHLCFICFQYIYTLTRLIEINLLYMMLLLFSGYFCLVKIVRLHIMKKYHIYVYFYYHFFFTFTLTKLMINLYKSNEKIVYLSKLISYQKKMNIQVLFIMNYLFLYSTIHNNKCIQWDSSSFLILGPSRQFSLT